MSLHSEPSSSTTSSSTTDGKYGFYHILIKYSFWIGLMIRIFVAFYGSILLDQKSWIPGVSYTDIDYYVVTDAAEYIRNGESPYRRATYRYTPFLAWIVSHINGKVLFCIADSICGWILERQQQQQLLMMSSSSTPNKPKSTTNYSSKALLSTYFLWTYNPLAINICTRGSSESFLVLLPVLATVAVLQSHRIRYRAILAGIFHGIAVHGKIYPVIYTLTIMNYLYHYEDTKNYNNIETTKSESMIKKQQQSIHQKWYSPIIFVMTFVLTWACITFLAVHLYGIQALTEGVLYHIGRVDHRHNYSMWWYPIYLHRLQLSGKLLFIPQALLLLLTSIGRRGDALGWTLFIQTYIFVTFNKVITAQYWTWYLCLLPLCIHSHIPITSRTIKALLGVGLSILLWLCTAYLLEIQGLPFHQWVWLASAIHFVANVHLLHVLMTQFQDKKDSTLDNKKHD
jgi:GPI mannosyltransferase 1 subunit M